MRPVRLQLKGFTSFKEETVVDFSHLDRFVVSGPTGAGKSSLFDAMTFALFSDAPRIDTGNKTDLVSLGKKSFFVALDFRVGPDVYRVLRNRTRAGTTGDQPDQLHKLGPWIKYVFKPLAKPVERTLFSDEPGDKVPMEENGGHAELIATGARGVNSAVEQLLGLNYAHFTQAVFLPQGKFAEFLRARAAERQKLLKDLLRLLIYERMRETAGREGKSHATHREQTERRLREDFAAVSDTARDEVAHQLAEQRQLMAEADRELPGLKLTCEETRQGFDWSKELEERRLDRARLTAGQPEIDALALEVEVASRAAGVVPMLEQAERARTEAAKREEALRAAQDGCGRELVRYGSAKANFDRARQEADLLPVMRDRIQRLAEAVGKLPLGDRLRGHVQSEEESMRARQAAQDQCEQSLTEASSKIGELQTGLHLAETERDALAQDAECQRRLEPLIESAIGLRTQREGLLELLRQAEQFEARAAQAQANVENAAKAEETAHKTARQAQRKFDDADKLLRADEDEHKAAHLRAMLKVGDPCPVCRRAVAKLPREEAVPELDANRQKWTEAEQTLRQANEALAQQRDALSRFQAMAQAVRPQADSSRAEATQRQQAIEQREQSLAESVADLLPDLTAANGKEKTKVKRSAGARAATATVEPVVTRIEDRILAAYRQAAGSSERYRQACQTVSDLQNQLSLKQKDAKVLQAEKARLEKELAAIRARLATDREELARVETEIRSITGTSDPAAESSKAQVEVERIERLLAESTRAEADANRDKQLAQSKVEGCAGEAETARDAFRKAELRATQTLAQAGFADAAAARAAFRPPAKVQEIKARIDENAVALQSLRARIDELEQLLKGKSYSREQCEQAEKAYSACAFRRNEAENAALLLDQQLRTMEERLEKSRQLRAELAEHERRQLIFDQLAKDLRSDNFQAFLLEETLSGLVRDASAQLMRLTGERYGLFFEEDKIFVIDHDNAAERRAIETLSGGETFLASLALALALSEQVQKIAGAVHLDCLFIDEGFGALDPETLRTVSDTIRALQVGGRMVGVITHVPEIKDEFDQRLLVDKKEGVSRVEVEIG